MTGEPGAEAVGRRSIAAGQGVRQALTGDGSVALYAEKSVNLPAEAFALPATAPEGLVNLPDRTSLFVGRARELALLDEAFREANGVVVQAVHGLGGIGKSTLAAHWAAGRVGSYNPVWWITAETPADLDTGLAELAVALQPALRDVLSREALRERAVQWLAGHEGWLLVLDNVSDPADVRGLLGRATGGRFLVTTRRASGWHKVAQPLSLDVLSPAEAAELFARIDGPGEEVDALCQELGYLPLAVEQAAAYCAEAGISAGRYLELLGAYPEEVFAQSAEGTDQGRTVARVWRVSLDRLAETPLAGRILGVVGWWASEGIPRGYLESMGTPVEVTEAVRRLAAHSLVKVHDDDTISVHRLVQAVARAEGGARHEAARVLLDNSNTFRGIDAEVRWLTHLEAFAGHADPETDGGTEAWLFNMGGLKSAQEYGRSGRTELHERAVAAAERAYGPRDKLTFTLRRSRATAYGFAGDHDRAVELLKRDLADHAREFGERDPGTFETRADLAEVLLNAGRLKEALKLAEKNAARAERVLGSEHEVALSVWSVWAKALRYSVEADDGAHAAEATDAIERWLARIEATQGEDNRFYDHVHWELIWVRAAAGDLDDATAHFERCIARRERFYGETSGITLNTRGAFATFLWGTVGASERARELVVQLISDWERLLGETPHLEWLRAYYARLLSSP
ncbi:tetratricopeptide repeat protein [Streptomyces sp. TLI_55]|uniref:tetratricopeptide repeat protein n=1 Tax=Streptomyces sp. TLI_55 TaxID=1938861 RepID=UPI000BD6F6A3|nr:tetratricopeptide repeat protein [Streptomyces sp. TLI_55]SNX62841.1 tetratricopeptide repeat protein [Streptomyces sp. TLI_55]